MGQLEGSLPLAAKGLLDQPSRLDDVRSGDVCSYTAPSLRGISCSSVTATDHRFTDRYGKCQPGTPLDVSNRYRLLTIDCVSIMAFIHDNPEAQIWLERHPQPGVFSLNIAQYEWRIARVAGGSGTMDLVPNSGIARLQRFQKL